MFFFATSGLLPHATFGQISTFRDEIRLLNLGYSREERRGQAVERHVPKSLHTIAFGLKDGNVLEGFVTREAANVVTIRNGTGAQIERRVTRTTPMMPEGLLADSNINDLASLLDYLESLGK